MFLQTLFKQSTHICTSLVLVIHFPSLLDVPCCSVTKKLKIMNKCYNLTFQLFTNETYKSPSDSNKVKISTFLAYLYNLLQNSRLGNFSIDQPRLRLNPISYGLSDSVAPMGGGLRGPPLKVIEGVIFERGHENRK